jgi:hypothetical protein
LSGQLEVLVCVSNGNLRSGGDMGGMVVGPFIIIIIIIIFTLPAQADQWAA